MNSPNTLGRVAVVALLSSSVLATGLTGCSDVGTNLVDQPEPVLSATTVDFGTMLVGQSATRSLSLSNEGTGTLAGTVSLSCAGYELVSGGGAFILSPGEVRTVELRFVPDAEGSFPCTLDLGPDVPAVQLVGIAAHEIAGAACAVDQQVIDFGFVAAGSTKLASFEIRSVGTAPLPIHVVSNAPGVTIIAGGGVAVLDPGTSQTVILSFEPVLGGPVSGTVVIGPGCPEVTVGGVVTTVSFAADVYPTLERNCASCHTWGFFYPSVLLTHISLVDPYWGLGLVTPFDPTQSRLYLKISGQYGGIMPPTGPMSAAEQSAIRDWILEGALNN
jgi:hypothetical protein